jgi:hypothetical protein
MVTTTAIFHVVRCVSAWKKGSEAALQIHRGGIPTTTGIVRAVAGAVDKDVSSKKPDR